MVFIMLFVLFYPYKNVYGSTKLPKSCKSYYLDYCKGEKKALTCLFKNISKLENRSCKRALLNHYKKLSNSKKSALRKLTKKSIQPSNKTIRDKKIQNRNSPKGFAILATSFGAILGFALFGLLFGVFYGWLLIRANQNFFISCIPIYGWYRIFLLGREPPMKTIILFALSMILVFIPGLFIIAGIINIYLYYKIAKQFGGGVFLTIGLICWIGVPYIMLTGRAYNNDDLSNDINPISGEGLNYEIKPEMRKVR